MAGRLASRLYIDAAKAEQGPTDASAWMKLSVALLLTGPNVFPALDSVEVSPAVATAETRLLALEGSPVLGAAVAGELMV